MLRPGCYITFQPPLILYDVTVLYRVIRSSFPHLGLVLLHNFNCNKHLSRPSSSIYDKKEKLPKVMPTGLHSLPYELFLQVIEQGGFSAYDLNSLLRCSRALANLLTPSLHKLAASRVVGQGKNVLAWSSERGYARQVASLIEYGSDIEAKDYSYKTPLIRATENGHLEVVRALLQKGANTEANAGRYIDDGTALHVAARAGHVEVVKLLLEFGADIEAKASRGARPLHWAVEDEQGDVVKLLLERNADINARRDYDQETPLTLTPENEGNDIFELLIENGADINIQGRVKETVLLQAVAKARTEMVKRLLEKGADIFTRNEFNDIALHLAVTYVGGDEIARLLLDKGTEKSLETTYIETWGQAYIDTQNDDGDTPLHLATRDEGRIKRIEMGKVTRQMAEENYDELGIDLNETLADPDIAVSNIQASAERSLTAFVRLLLERGADPNYANRVGRVPLHNVAANGYTDMARLLLDHGALVDIEDVDGRTPLLRAAKVLWTVRRNPAEASGRIEVMKLLLERGSNPHHEDKGGCTVGEWVKGNNALAKFLGEDYDDHFMDMDYCDHNGKRALVFGICHYPIIDDD